MAEMTSNGYQLGRLVEQSGGMVDSIVYPTLLNDNEAHLLKNCSLDEKGTIKTCKGRTERFSSAFDASNSCNGMTAFYPDTTTSRLVMGAGTKLYKDTPHLLYDWTDQADFEESGSVGTNIDTSTTAGSVKLKATKPTATFIRNSLAYKQNGIAAGNLLTANQSSVETDTTGLLLNGSGTAITRVTTEHWNGSASLKVVTAAATGHGFFIKPFVNAVGGQIYTASVYLKGSGTVVLILQERSNDTYLRQSASTAITLNSTWQRVSITATIGADANQVNIYVTNTTASANTYYADGLQIEQNSVASDWVLGGMATNIPRFEAGKFGNGIFIEEGTTNEYAYPTFNTSEAAGGWYHWGTAGHEGTFGQTQDKNYIFGNQSYAHWVENGAGAKYNYLVFQSPFLGGTPSYRSLTVICCMSDGSEVTGSKCYPSWNGRDSGVPNNQWTKIERIGQTKFYKCTVEGIHQDGTNDLIGVYVKPGYKVYFSQAHCERKPYATSFINGTRAAEALTIPTAGILSPEKGTVNLWVNVNAASKRQVVDDYPTLFSVLRHSSNNYGLWLCHSPTTAHWKVYIGDGITVDALSTEDSYTPDGWHMFTVSWTASELKLFIDGAQRGVTVENPSLPAAFGSTANIGSWRSFAHFINTVIDDFAIFDYAASDAEVASWYASGEPIVNDGFATCVMRFNDTLNVEDLGGFVWQSATKDISAAVSQASGKIEYSATVPGDSSIGFETRTSSDSSTWDDWTAVDSSGNILSTYKQYIQVRARAKASGADKPILESIILSYDNTPAAVELATGFTAGSQFYFATLLSKLVIVNRLDAPRVWDGTNAVAVLGGSPPHAQYVASHKNYLFVANSSANPSRLYFSDLLDIEDWPALNFIDISPNDGDWITGILPYDDYLLIAKNRSIWLLLGSGTSDFEIRRIHDGVGCVAPRSLVKMPQAFGFASHDGFYMSDLSQEKVVTERLKVTWDGLNSRRLGQIAVAYYDHKLRIDVPNGESIDNNLRVIYDTIRQCLYLEEFSDHASCYAKFTEAGQEILLYGHSTEGQVSQADDGTTDAGSAITMTWETKHFNFGSSAVEKKVKRLYLALVPASSAVTLSIYLIMNGVEQATPLTATISGDATQPVITLRLDPRTANVRKVKTIGYRIVQSTTNGGVKVHELLQEYRIRKIKETV